MRLSDTPDRYGTLSKANHWLAALAIIGLMGLGLVFEDLPRGPERLYLQNLHISIGACVVILLLFRVAWRVAQSLPPETVGPAWERKAARIVHLFLLAAIAVLAVSGPLLPWTAGRSIEVFDWFSLPSPLPTVRPLHGALEWIHAVTAKLVLLPLLLVHVAATLKHALLDRDGRWRRIMPGDWHESPGA